MAKKMMTYAQAMKEKPVDNSGGKMNATRKTLPRGKKGTGWGGRK